MLNRLGIFIGVIVALFGLLMTHPWRWDGEFPPGGQETYLLVFAGLAFAAWAFFAGLGWVFGGRTY